MSDQKSIEGLLARAEKTAARDPRCATQLVVARRGEVLVEAAFGSAPFGGGGGVDGEGATVRAADERTLFSIHSVSKALTSAAVWIVLQEGKLHLEDTVKEHIPEFGAKDKGGVTVEHLLTHTAGFPTPRFEAADWPDAARRAGQFARWPLEWPPGTRFVYHPSSTMWVLAELITRATDMDYREFMRSRIFEPAGIEDVFMGLPESEAQRVADVVLMGDVVSEGDRGASPVDAPVVTAAMLEHANRMENRREGGPGGGAIATARGIALLYQAILGDLEGWGPGIWRRATLLEALRIRNPGLIDPMTGQPALRGLGVVIAGDEGRLWRGFSHENSPSAFGHMGAGGQISWADPERELSFAFLTNGAEQDAARQGANGFRMSTLAVACG